MLTPIVLAVCLSVAALASAADNTGPGRETIAEILTRAKAWHVFIEHGGGEQPSSRAGVQRWEFFRRGDEVVGRTVHMAPGYNGEFEVTVRDNGFDFARCCRYPPGTPMSSVDYDPKDAKYPFKRTTTPQKWWLSPEL